MVSRFACGGSCVFEQLHKEWLEILIEEALLAVVRADGTESVSDLV